MADLFSLLNCVARPGLVAATEIRRVGGTRQKSTFAPAQVTVAPCQEPAARSFRGRIEA
jgi:hypothetical protein